MEALFRTPTLEQEKTKIKLTEIVRKDSFLEGFLTLVEKLEEEGFCLIDESGIKGEFYSVLTPSNKIIDPGKHKDNLDQLQEYNPQSNPDDEIGHASFYYAAYISFYYDDIYNKP